MSWRIINITSRAKLDYKMDYLVVRTEETTTRIHLSEIYMLMIESTAVSLTAYLLSELTKKKIKVVFCDEKNNPQCEVVPLYGSHDTSRKIREQIKWNEETKKLVWSEIIKAKITGQMYNIPPDMIAERELLAGYIAEIQPGDSTNREGHSAKVYFNALFGKSFTRSEENDTNAMLNYGYSILLSAFNKTIVSCGYLTELGLFHDNMFNFFNLSCDLMEPFRPFVDRVVIESPPTKFEHAEKIRMLNVLNTQIKIADTKQFISTAIRIYVLSVFEAIVENDISKIKFPSYEL